MNAAQEALTREVLALAPTVALEPVRFAIVDLRADGRVVASVSTQKGARRSCDKRNLEYGAHRYAARAVYSDGSSRPVF